jgi:hypothetical protein
MTNWGELGIPPNGSSDEQRAWLQKHKVSGHPVYLVREERSVPAFDGLPGELWACDCEGESDPQWFHADEP